VREKSPPGRQGDGRSATAAAGGSRRRGSRPSKGRGGLRAEAIVEAAIRIADSEGLPAVSIRRVAAELDARAMSLYDHFDNKDDLLAAMAEEVSGESLIEGPMPGGWREALALLSRRVYVMLVAHPWLVAISPIQYRRLGPNAVRSAKQYIEALEPLGLEPSELWFVAGTVNDYLVGSAHRTANRPPGGELQDSIPESELQETPELASLPDSFRSRASIERFQRGLEIVLKGIEAELEIGKAKRG
jgi:AcrR family transcriptional regulator